MMTDYQPIDCGLYSRYELAIMHREQLRVCWRDATGNTRVQTLDPRDLQTRAAEEFLIAIASDGQRLELRLDRILEATPLRPSQHPEHIPSPSQHSDRQSVHKEIGQPYRNPRGHDTR